MVDFEEIKDFADVFTTKAPVTVTTQSPEDFGFHISKEEIELMNKINCSGGTDATVDEYRRIRDIATSILSKAQKRIDEMVLAKNDFNKYIGKYVYCFDIMDNLYMKVERVERLYSGTQLIGKCVEIEKDEYGVAKSLMISDDYTYTIDLLHGLRKGVDVLSKVHIITEEKFFEALESAYKDLANKLKE